MTIRRMLSTVAVVAAVAGTVGCGEDKLKAGPAGGGKGLPGDLKMDPSSSGAGSKAAAPKSEAAQKSNQQ